MATFPPLATPMLFTVGKLTGFTAKLAFHENQGSVNDMVWSEQRYWIAEVEIKPRCFLVPAAAFQNLKTYDIYMLVSAAERVAMLT